MLLRLDQITKALGLRYIGRLEKLIIIRIFIAADQLPAGFAVDQRQSVAFERIGANNIVYHQSAVSRCAVALSLANPRANFSTVSIVIGGCNDASVRKELKDCNVLLFVR